MKWLLLAGLILTSCSGRVQGDFYDVVVYGGTPSGIIAAVAAARHNANVVLLEQTRHLGGMNTSGLNTAESEHMIDNAITGLAREFYIRLGLNYSENYFQTFPNGKASDFHKGDPAFFWESHDAEKTFGDMLREAGVKVFFDKNLDDVSMSGHSITSIKLKDGTVYSGKIFIDCTYEGDLMAKSGVSYTYGRESQSSYNEKYAGIRFMDDTLSGKTVDAKGNLLPYFTRSTDLTPGESDRRVMNYNFRPTMTQDTSNFRPISRPAGYDSTRYTLLADFLKDHPETTIYDLIGIYKRGHDKFEFNNRQYSTISLGLFGGNVQYPNGDDSTRAVIYDNIKSYTLGYLYFLAYDPRVPEHLRDQTKSFGYAKDEFVDNDNFPYYLYIREGRRMISDFVFTEHDILTNRTKDDAVALGSHWIDSHHVQRVAISDSTFTNEGRIWHKVTQPFEIPYRVILPKRNEVNNLLVPVCASLSHVGFCSYRLEPTWMQMGHVAGTAAGMALEGHTNVHDLKISALQDQLGKEGMIFKIANLGPYHDYDNDEDTEEDHLQ